EALVRRQQSGNVAGNADDSKVGTAVVARATTEPRDRLHRIEVEVLRALRIVAPDQHGAAAADARHLGLGYADREGSRDGGIDCVAAGAEHFDAGVARERAGR